MGSDNPVWVVRNVILDSLLFLRVLPADARRVMDLGAGAGVPGVPLKVVRSEIEMVLLEARQRRASFLAEVVRQLGLSGCSVVAERAEAVADRYAGTFDAVVMRCAGRPTAVISLALQFVRTEGVVILSGPPDPEPTERGRWLEVPGIDGDETRRFLVASRAPGLPEANG